ncbi:SIMPL domain-containing protein [Legionella nagasakiensis]|uniref:SIMPL domain-containing protein n=1 Tax=Legionella nagasakiensis TaxID=535290 RepID=UPI0013EF7E89|nr:SIMPL domain-containing protein [Legionella nagasakiensis]
MRSKNFPALILGCGVALSGFFIAKGLIDSREYSRFVQVKGLAERVVKSDEAIWTLNIKLVSNELPALYQAIDEAQSKTQQFLSKQGFKDSEISTNPVAVTDNQSVSYNQNQDMPRYSADTGLTVTTANVDKVAATVQKTGDLVQQGIVVTASNVIYRFNDLNAIKPEMLDDATQSAYEAAKSFASNAKASLGYIRLAKQGLFTIADANSNYDSGNAIMKKVRVVTTVEYQLK